MRGPQTINPEQNSPPFIGLTMAEPQMEPFEHNLWAPFRHTFVHSAAGNYNGACIPFTGDGSDCNGKPIPLGAGNARDTFKSYFNNFPALLRRTMHCRTPPKVRSRSPSKDLTKAVLKRTASAEARFLKSSMVVQEVPKIQYESHCEGDRWQYGWGPNQRIRERSPTQVSRFAAREDMGIVPPELLDAHEQAQRSSRSSRSSRTPPTSGSPLTSENPHNLTPEVVIDELDRYMGILEDQWTKGVSCQEEAEHHLNNLMVRVQQLSDRCKRIPPGQQRAQQMAPHPGSSTRESPVPSRNESPMPSRNEKNREESPVPSRTGKHRANSPEKRTDSSVQSPQWKQAAMLNGQHPSSSPDLLEGKQGQQQRQHEQRQQPQNQQLPKQRQKEQQKQQQFGRPSDVKKVEPTLERKSSFGEPTFASSSRALTTSSDVGGRFLTNQLTNQHKRAPVWR